MDGKLFLYDEESRLAAFESGIVGSKTCIVFIAGMTEGFLSLPFLPSLSTASGNVRNVINSSSFV